MKTIVIIPARYNSSRLPGKPLKLIGDKPIIQHVVEKASSFTDNVYVATDDEDIYNCVKEFGGKPIMTSTKHKSGTDRCREASSLIRKDIGNFELVINIQGDEPFITKEQIKTLADCFENPKVDIATLAKKITSTEDLENPNKVKVISDNKGIAVYFSRSPIPYIRGIDKREWVDKWNFYKHIGMYAYRANILDEIAVLPKSKLEEAESLEQLRWLENGYKIAIEYTDEESIGIDTPEDLEEANKYFSILSDKALKF